MSVLEWKKVNLLKLEYLSNKLRGINADITAYCSNENQKVFCDVLGNIFVYFKNWDYISFPTNNGPINLCSLTNDGHLVTLHQKDDNLAVFLKVYSLQKLTKKNGAPCVCSARLPAFSATTVLEAANFKDLLIIAIGFTKGDILLHYSPMSRDLTSNFRNLSTGGMRSVTGLRYELRYATGVCNMFVSTTDTVFRYPLGDNNNPNVETKLILDTVKTAHTSSNCCALHNLNNSEGTYFVVGRDDAIYCFTYDGRGPCYALHGQKKYITWSENYMFVVIQPKKIKFDSKPFSTLIALDIQNKLVVFNDSIDGEVDYIFEQNNSCTIISKSTKEILILQEKDMHSKINLLTSKHLYDVALQITENVNIIEKKESAYINLKHGHYLMQKGLTNEAVDKYIRTIGVIKPYDIIQRLLDPRHNKVLIKYLHALVASNQGNDEHKELLYNCTERLHMPSKIQFQCNSHETMEEPQKNIVSNIDTIINYRSAKSAEILNAFIENHDVHDKVVKTLHSLSESSVYDIFMDIGDQIISKNPEVVLEEFKLFVKHKIIQEPERYIPLFNLNEELGTNFLESLIEHNTNCSYKIYNYLLEHYLRLWKQNQVYTNTLLQFMEKHKEHLYPEHALILCKNYSFLPGINQILGTNVTDFSTLHDDINLHKYIQTINKDATTKDCSKNSNFQILCTLLQKNPQYLLQTLQNISKNDAITVSNIKSFFLKENLQKVIDIDSQTEAVNNLSENIKSLKELLFNYNNNPIEYRNSICDICRQDLKHPSVFFLCQHSFHKDCISSYTQSSCVACLSNKEKAAATKSLNAPSDQKDEANTDISKPLVERLFSLPMGIVNLDDLNPIKTVNKSIPKTATVNWHGPFQTQDFSNLMSSSVSSTSAVRNVSKNPFDEDEEEETLAISNTTTTTNPFEMYDNNLNPFG